MKKILLFTLISVFSLTTMAQTKIRLAVAGRAVTGTLVDNDATRELATLLAAGPVDISMSDYGGFEKVGALPRSFTTSNRQTTTVPGDIMLYQGNNMVIFYGSNSWSYTPLGSIDNATATSVKEFLGEGNITLSISLESLTGIEEVSTEADGRTTVFDLSGRPVNGRPLRPGIYIVNGRKIHIQ